MKNIFSFTLISLIAYQATAQIKISFKDSAYYPEGIAYNNITKDFYVGSVKTGTISKIAANGSKQDIYIDPALKSSFGMKLDLKANLLWVCTGDPNYSIYKTPATDKKLAHLVAIDPATGKKTKDVDLSRLFSGKHFINDLTMDNMGNMFVTDSYSPVIYKLDKDSKASIFVENDLFKSIDVGLNGIVFNNKGFLLTVNNSSGSVLKVDLSTKAVTMVKIDQFFSGADGLIMMNDQDLVLVQNKGTDKIFKLTSTDNWSSAKVVAATSTDDRFQNPSTAVLKGKDIYVVNAKLNEIEDPSKKPSEEFIIQQAILKPMN